MRTYVVISPSPALPWAAEMVCFTILGEHDALKSDGPTLLKEHFAREWYPLVLRTDVVISLSPALPWGAEMVCFTILGEHDALKSDKPTSLKLIPLSSETPTFDANLCRHITLTCPPLGS